MRVKIVKAERGYKEGEIVEVSRNVAFGLVDSGIGVLTKDMTKTDYKITKSDEGQADAKPGMRQVRKNI